MPVTDAYAAAPEYRARVEKKDAADDTTILTQLTAVSRFLDRQCGDVDGPRFFTLDASAVARVYDGNPSLRLWIHDVGDKAAIAVAADLTGNWAYADAGETLTEGTHYWVGPRNAGLGAEPRPYTFLDLIPNNGVLSEWSRGGGDPYTGLVQVAAKYGWPAVPGAIKEATITITRQLRDLEESGFTLSVQNIDAAIQQSPQSAMVLRDIVREYGRKSVFV
jgi:hypothetical protein